MGDVLVDAVSPSAVHLCVDMQRIFSSDGPWPTPWMERVLPTVTRIAERFPERTGRWRSYYEKWRETTRDRLDPRLLELMPPLAALVPPARVFETASAPAGSGPL
jgi:hypothetical protein